eukprot:gene56531-40140_t
MSMLLKCDSVEASLETASRNLAPHAPPRLSAVAGLPGAPAPFTGTCSRDPPEAARPAAARGYTFQGAAALTAARRRREGVLHDGAPLSATACGGKGSGGEDVQWTPLLWAARWGRAGAIRELAAAGADVGWRDCFGRTALRHAAGPHRP